MAIAHITAAQMKVLGAAMRRQFEIDAMTMLRRMHPQTTGRHSDDTLQLFLRHGIERAKLSRLKSVSEIQRWLRLMLRLGPYFDSEHAPHLAGIRAALGNVEVYGPLRLDEAEASAIAPEPL